MNDKRFSLYTLYDSAYEGIDIKCRPVIGITANHEGMDATLREAYCQQVVRAGGVPVIIPAIDDVEVIRQTLNRIDALILSGGGDHNPLWMNEQPSPRLGNINATRDRAELLITRLAYNRCMPMLGICRGMQTLAIALGGHVTQDIYTAPREDALASHPLIKHSQDADRTEPTHQVEIAQGSTLASIYNTSTLYVNSFHHQAVDDTGRHLIASATSVDGIIEAMESCEFKSIIGVQWHPEWLGNDGLPLFQWLTQHAAEYRKAQEVHNRILSVDSHCDTPMFFHQGVNFLKRDQRILVDLHKMREGRLDATTMVCYLPQPWTPDNGAPEARKGKTFSELVHYPINSPREYTDFIFDEIERIVADSHGQIAQARSVADIKANKTEGRKSIILGIENGLAIENDINNLRHFAERGITYMTLCHNGDNLICDSAKGAGINNGVSAYGKEVIREMNRLGIMVDLSHAGEKSFYDALEISSTPIVCSHSNCRSLCDHPRNLTDDQMRRLAEAGGIMQITLYAGFLRQDEKATILDAINHLEHTIAIMGIDHVGIGTDFDGDGGVPGMADASEVINLTMHLLRRGYSEEDIRKIWGGNWLKLMQEIQKNKI